MIPIIEYAKSFPLSVIHYAYIGDEWMAKKYEHHEMSEAIDHYRSLEAARVPVRLQTLGNRIWEANLYPYHVERVA